MILFWLLLAAPDAPAGLEAADALAARARSLEGEARRRAASEALGAYAALLKAHAKDRRLVPRLRRRRASLFKREGRLEEALAEHDAIVEGRARRADRARALLDGARLLADRQAAIRRLGRVIDGYRDVARTRARAARLRGALLEEAGRLGEAASSYRLVVDECRFEEKEAIAAYDALALLALRRGRVAEARRWIRRCFRAYEKRAARGDRKGAFLGRQLGAMESPAALAAAAGAGERR